MKTIAGLKINKLVQPGLEEWFVTSPLGARAECHRLIREAGATIVAEEVFGAAPTAAVRPEWPVTWLWAQPRLTGVQLHAVRGVPVQRIEQDGRVVGSVFRAGAVRHCRLGGLRPATAAGAPADQARTTFALLAAALQDAEMTFANVARTWFYLDKILEWYGAFNQVRDGFFRDHKVFDGLVPASTGIGGANAAGTALMAGAYAVSGGTLAAVPSPLQCPALQYGSAFSRAVELALPDQCRLWVSGTASIAPGGQTVHGGDVARQIALTMKVVTAILDSRGLDWRDVSRAIAYVREEATVARWQEYLVEHGWSDLPVVTVQNVICRDDLLFEIEVDAVQVTAAKSRLGSAGPTPAG